MAGTAKQPKVSKTHRTASQKAGTTIYIDNMSQTPTPCRTMPPPKTKTNTSHSTGQSTQEIHQNSSHSGPPTCCKSDLQPVRHASEEVNTEKVNTHWVHSYRMEHAEHFPAPMEMCMDNHHTQTTERTQ